MYGRRMRFLLGVVLISAGCAPTVHAYTLAYPRDGIVGERRIRLAAHDDEADVLEALLRQRGFAVARDVPGVIGPPNAPFVLSTEGTCSSWGGTPLKIDVFKVSTSERIYQSQVTESGDCPNGFFRDTVAELARLWR